jgi:flagellar protein FliS
MESNMSANKVATSYKQADNEYVKGLETAHGRIKLLYETLLSNLNKIEDKHPKTDFLAFGKCQNALKILSSSLDMAKGGDLAQNLYDLYIYCSEKLREYLEDKNQQKIVEVKRIISGLSEAWKEIKE